MSAFFLIINLITFKRGVIDFKINEGFPIMPVSSQGITGVYKGVQCIKEVLNVFYGLLLTWIDNFIFLMEADPGVFSFS